MQNLNLSLALADTSRFHYSSYHANNIPQSSKITDNTLQQNAIYIFKHFQILAILDSFFSGSIPHVWSFNF